MNIGEAAEQSGMSAKMIRYYESVALLKSAKRSPSGYRIYSANDVHTLRFIRQARVLGFSVEKIRELLALWQNQRRKSETVRKLALEHVAEIESNIADLQEMKATLMTLVKSCHGDSRAECPILEGLSGSIRN